MKLSILICTVPDRVSKLNYLLISLNQQALGKPVEIKYLGDNRTQTTGAKRNDLIMIAKGEYVAFIDDDDVVSKNYVESILEGIKHNTDVINFTVKYTCANYSRPVYYSIKYDKDFNAPTHFERLPNHLMVVKRELALKAMFPDKTIGEDAEYAKRLHKLLKTEHNINDTLYEYLDYE